MDVLNRMCEDCSRLGRDCPGTSCTVWTNCAMKNTEEDVKMEKIHAYQVAPENQDPRMFYIDRSGNFRWEDAYWENIGILPRPHYHYYLPDVVQETYEKLENNDYTDEELSGKYSPVADAIRDYGWDYLNNPKTLCSVLRIATGKEYKYMEIHGCSQGDWQVIIYPVDEYNADDIKVFETMFFNTGTEWTVSIDTPEAIGEDGIYCIKSDPDGIRQEIADAEGTVPENVVLHQFTGYTRIPQYEII